MGRLRCWAIRGLILAVVAGVAAGGWVAHGWVSPEKVRAALVAALRQQFPDADVHVGSARLRLFGGIRATDLKLTRRGDPTPFLEAPTAVIVHDKEQLARGQLVVRKVELDGPTVRLVRRPDGTWNVSGLGKPGTPDRPVPTFVVRNATVLLTDQRPGGLPPVALLGARLNLLNDPVLLLKFDAQFTVAPGATGSAPVQGGLAIPVGVSAQLNRVSHTVAARVEVPDLAVGPDLAPALDRLHPALGEYLTQFSARVGVKALLEFNTQPGRLLSYDVKLDVRDGRWENESLPWPVEHLTAEVRARDGKVSVANGAAKLGKAPVTIELETRAPAEAASRAATEGGPYGLVGAALRGGPSDSPLAALEGALERAKVTVRDLALTDDLFARLPATVKAGAEKARRLFSPVGAADLEVQFTRTGPRWERTIEFRPNRLAVAYEKFRYPVEDLAGWVRKVTTSEGADEFRVQLTGSAGGRRVEITGRVGTEEPDPLIDLKIAGTDIPIDDRLFAALPKKYADALSKLHTVARADFTALIRQPPGVNRCENTFTVQVYDGSINYAHFPYPVEKVRGKVVVNVVGVNPARPAGPGPADDTVRLCDFEGVHAGGRLWMPSGFIDPIPGTKDRKFTLRLQGENCPIDADLRTAVAALHIDDAWETFAPRGHVTFGADVEIIDRHQPDPPAGPLQVATKLPGEPPFDPTSDLRLILNFRGPTITPEFFRYVLTDLAGVLRYRGGEVKLDRFAARHGRSRFGLDAAVVRFGRGGEVWANVGGLTARPLVADAVFLTALPGKLRTAVEELKLAGASLDTGIDWQDVHGAFASIGRYEGTHVGAVLGNGWLD
ncbi:MAG TPA: hypothetical protein VFG68_05085, partial [Fimbriiglobus sp.]|nr:hypothetical protein [Fimbriiglobus sp.]